MSLISSGLYIIQLQYCLLSIDLTINLSFNLILNVHNRPSLNFGFNNPSIWALLCNYSMCKTKGRTILSQLTFHNRLVRTKGGHYLQMNRRSFFFFFQSKLCLGQVMKFTKWHNFVICDL